MALAIFENHDQVELVKGNQIIVTKYPYQQQQQKCHLGLMPLDAIVWTGVDSPSCDVPSISSAFVRDYGHVVDEAPNGVANCYVALDRQGTWYIRQSSEAHHVLCRTKSSG